AANCGCGHGSEVGSRVNTRNGWLSTDFTLPATYSQGQTQSLRFVYRSDSAWPQPIIPFDLTIPVRAAVPPKISYKATLGGVDQAGESFVHTEGLSESRDETLRGAVRLDAADLETGVYPVSVRLTSHYQRSRIASLIEEKVTVVNAEKSPFGAGWGIAGLSRLTINYDGSVLISDGNGATTRYQSAPTDLSDWRQEGPSTNAQWVRSADGSSVVHRNNSDLWTFFVAPETVIDTTIRGDFRVQTSSDDDYIGFVFGYRSPFQANGDAATDYDFLLFDWRQRPQSGALEGFTLSRVTGPRANFWNHTGEDLQLLAAKQGSGTGWRHNVTHTFELDYTTEQIRI
ncbi:MAG TPA: hypothetical protein EYP90_05910, partial [Chromatiaceae bacterium]|nr:hypothetical protein [Chromatiaceae bacterium]